MFIYKKEYDVIVVGGGHAGVEAALAAAKMGCEVLLLTLNIDTIAQMSCNPAIGGQAKGQLVREIDALGGQMGRATDLAGLQFRMLNKGKGAAVWSPRAQCDKRVYHLTQKLVCEQQPGLEIKQAHTTGVLCKNGVAFGVQTDSELQFNSKAVVVTAGTFLSGLIHVGKAQQPGGRSGERASIGISDCLRELGLTLGRFKTGTPPRLSRKSIDFSKMETQLGDDPISYFSFWKDELFHVEQHPSVCEYGNRDHPLEDYPYGGVVSEASRQLPCFLTYTTEETAAIVTDNLHLSPIYSGRIEGLGPRYCPSIEDKIVKFPHHIRHQIFLEPEGVRTDEIYVNGLSTSLPASIQTALVRSVVGCERAEVTRLGYAVEYDYVIPSQLYTSLETKVCRGLFLAGQINGTSGYEEAAAQGLMAGINASRLIQGMPPTVLTRDQAYIGVLIDDLVTKGTSEPYRLFTSRAEHRLLLRQDNADLRLSAVGYAVGLLPEPNYRRTMAKQNLINEEIARLQKLRRGTETIAQILRRPEMTYEKLPERNAALHREVTEQVEIEIKYAGYIQRQRAEVEKFKINEHKKIPSEFDYALVPSLRVEARQKLSTMRPTSVGQAARISGVSPADIGLLLVWLKRASANAIRFNKRNPIITQNRSEEAET